MRTISYDEFVYNKKYYDEYTYELLPLLETDKKVLHDLITRKVKKCSELFFNPKNGIDTLEVLFYEGYITKEDVINAFNSIKIDSKEIYEKIYQYTVMFDYRKNQQDFPFKLHIDTEFLKEKLKNAPEQFKVDDIEFKYYLDNFTKMDYDETILKRRNSRDHNKFKTALLEDSTAYVLGQNPNRRNDYPGFSDVWYLMDYLQIFIDDNLITNNQINKILSEVDITNIDWFIHIEEYLRTMLRLNKFKWHRYTLDIDVKMLQNKVEGAFNTPITEEKGGICKEFLLNLYNILDSPLKFDKTPQQRHELDMYYREKYRKLYEAELKEKTNK
jgi:hypothetical protein